MSAPWIEASRPPKVPGTDAHAACMTPLVFLILHISWITFGLVVAMIIAIGILSVQGRSVKWLLQKGKCKLRGGRVSARPLFYRRRANNAKSYDDCEMSLFRKVG